MAGVAFFGRDSTATLPVWSATQGYPGDALYREFHRDLGWDLPETLLQQAGITSRRPLGLKLHSVSPQGTALEDKLPYNPDAAAARVEQHAIDYLQGRRRELDSLARAMERRPLLVAPFDAELFGHWWFEGPRFLAALFRQAGDNGVYLVRLKDVLSRLGCNQLKKLAKAEAYGKIQTSAMRLSKLGSIRSLNSEY